jgi:hypothetical protein
VAAGGALRRRAGIKSLPDQLLIDVAAPEPDEDGEPITTMVVDWTGPVRMIVG